MDDIVTRLREEWAECRDCMAGNDAADEIERLRDRAYELADEVEAKDMLFRHWQSIAKMYIDKYEQAAQHGF